MSIYRPEEPHRATRAPRQERRSSRVRVAERPSNEEAVFKLLGVAVLSAIALMAKLTLLP